MNQRIVFHVPSLRGGGAERVFVLMASELAGRGQDVTLLTWNAEGPNAALVSSKVCVVDLKLAQNGGRFGKIGTLRGLVRSTMVIRRLKPDAVYSGPEFANLIMTLVLLLSASVARFFPTVHAASAMGQNGLGARLAIMLSRLVAWRATKVVGVSDGVGRDLVARGFPADKVITINNPFLQAEGTHPQSQRWRVDLSTMGDGPVIGSAGSLIAVKDQLTLLRAFAVLRTKRPARLVIFGEGPLRDELVAFAATLGISDRVLLPGYVDNLASCYEALDLFVLTSITEGFGNVLVEAMAVGIPVVSTDAPYGPREILRDGVFGPLVPVGDHEALADAMERVLERPTDAVLLKQRAADFSVETIGDRYLALLNVRTGATRVQDPHEPAISNAIPSLPKRSELEAQVVENFERAAAGTPRRHQAAPE